MNYKNSLFSNRQILRTSSERDIKFYQGLKPSAKDTINP